MNHDGPATTPQSYWSKLVLVVQSPIRLFGLLALICNSIFVICATFFRQAELFLYCIHMFIAIVGLLFLMALWTPRSLYHPMELKDVPEEKLPPHRPWLPTVCGFLGFVLYMAYQLIVILKVGREVY